MAGEENKLLGIENPKDFSQNVLQALVKCIKLSTTIPNSGSEYAYYSTFKGFQILMQKERNSVLEIIKSLIPGQSFRSSFEKNDDDDKFDILLDMNASMYENIGAQIDEVTCPKKAQDDLIVATKNLRVINTSWNRTPNKKLKPVYTSYSLLSSKNIQRPQFTFEEKVDNSNSLFIPTIKEKPHALKPLAILIEKNEYNEEEYSHPYEWELQHLRYFEKQLLPSQPIVPKSLDETPLIMVNTEDELNTMMQDLMLQSEIAIDIENHSYRSFQGFSCLLQISTREKDYIIDAIKLRSKLNLLNEITTNPKIVKVLHGADMDILWLQRDFGVYVVNLFDTGQATRTLSKFGLGFSHFSLAYLMKHYCNLDVDKQFQLADWRIRPLPDPLIKYAREDTHYLLYIYDSIKNDLLEYGKDLSKDLLQMALDSSKEICLKKYKKLIFNDEKYLELCNKSRKMYDERQKICIKELYAWRDHLARVEDESYGYILPNHMLLKIAEVMPKDHPGIQACCNPVPPLVMQQLNELNRIILKARTSPVNKLFTAADGLQIEPEAAAPTIVNNTLNSLHDFHFDIEEKIQRFQHPAFDSLFNGNDSSSLAIPLKTTMDLPLKSQIRTKQYQDSYSDAAQKVAKTIDEENKTPFARYQLTLEYHRINNPSESEAAEVPNKESSNKSFIEIMNSSQSSADISVSNSLLDTSSNQVSESAANSSTTAATGNDPAELDNTDVEMQMPVRKKKKRKKTGRGVPDVPLESPKQSKASEITPFDYASEARIDQFLSTMKESTKSFNPNEATEKQQKKFKKRKHAGKQFTNKKFKGAKNWPKN